MSATIRQHTAKLHCMIVLYFDKIAISRNGKPPTRAIAIRERILNHGQTGILEGNTSSRGTGLL